MDDAKFSARIKETNVDVLFIYQAKNHPLAINVALFILL